MSDFRLFFTPEEVAAQEAADAEQWAETAEDAHAPAMARGANCRECPLWGCQRGPVMPHVVPNSRLAIISEAPGKNEVEDGHPLVGMSGKILDTHLGVGGIARADCTVTSVLLCQPPEDYETYLTKLKHQANKSGQDVIAPAVHCYPRLKRDLADANAVVEYAIGNQALKALAGHHGIAYGKERKVDKGEIHIAHLRKQHGAPVVLQPGPVPEGPNHKVLISSYHPAFALRGAKAWMPVIKKVIERAARIAVRNGEIDWKRPPFNIDPTIEDLQAFRDLVFEHGTIVTCDIETRGAHTQTCVLRCVGMGTTTPNGNEHIIVAPFADMDDTLRPPLYADPERNTSDTEWERYDLARSIVRDIMDNAKLAGQNFSFDTSVMQRLQFMSRSGKRWLDTMLMHHDTDSNDLPHDLGFITSEQFEAPHHKDDADHKTVNNVDYPRLKEYNGDDVLTTMRLVEPLSQRIIQLGTSAQFETDTKLAPVVRDMGDLGLVIDERERMKLAEVLAERCEYYLSEFRFNVACTFDPETPPNYAPEVDKVKAAIKGIEHDEHRSLGEKRREQMGIFHAFAERHGFDRLNPRSGPQLAGWLFEQQGLVPQLNTDGFDYDEEAGDTPGCGQAALLKLIDKYPHVADAVESLLEYRAYDKLHGTYVADKKGRIRTVDWTQWGLPAAEHLRILNTVYKLHIIPSGRMSTQPAIQNWPAVGKANMRTMVVSPYGHCMVGADYDQLELRIYAIVAQDKLLLEAFQGKDKHGKPIDPHSLNAAALLCESEAKIWDWYYKIAYDMDKKEKKYWRTVAKRFCYLETYGGEEDKLFSTMASSRNKVTGKKDFPNLELKDVLVWHERWHKLHPETKRWQQACQRIAYADKVVGIGIPDYRKRHFPGGIDKKNAPVNHTIQGFAAAIANRGLLRLVDAIPHRGWSPVSGINLQVHDYIGGYVPRARAWEAKHVVEEALYFEHNGMPFTCTAEISNRWSDQG